MSEHPMSFSGLSPSPEERDYHILSCASGKYKFVHYPTGWHLMRLAKGGETVNTLATDLTDDEMVTYIKLLRS